MRSLLAFALLAFVAAPVLAQNVSADPNFGDVRVEEGFPNDPYTIEVVAGGDIEPAVRGCDYGAITQAPDVDLYYDTSGSSTLYIYAVSGDDTTILVNLPDGNWACDDDSYDDGDPIVVIRGAESGLFNIWVGTYGDDPAEATLFISEIDPR
ncbi:peptidase S1 [Rubrivirga sp. IMCC43871]|uniref:peptidase S1 n=1 Tax=Rubrivirga sp. IMCC43871 TaxID=3391575 RepID=UPI00398FA0F1